MQVTRPRVTLAISTTTLSTGSTMKKIFKLFCAVAAIAALASSCSEPKDEKGLQNNANETVVLTAGYDGTRTTLDENFAPLWETGDQLCVSDGTHFVSAAVSEKFISAKMTDAEQEKLVEDTIRDLEGVTWQN